MAFPLTPVLDNFNRTENPLSTNWDAGLLNSLRATGTVCVGNSTSFNIQMYSTTFTGYLEVYAIITAKGATGHELFLTAMGKDTGSLATIDGYDVHFTVQAGTDTWELRRIDNGTATVLASGSGELVIGDQVGLRVADGHVSWFLNGTEISRVADSTYTGSGKIGLTIENTTWSLNDFGGGAIPVAPKLHHLRQQGIG